MTIQMLDAYIGPQESEVILRLFYCNVRVEQTCMLKG